MLIDVISVRTCPDFQLDLEFTPWDRIAVPAVFERVRVD